MLSDTWSFATECWDLVCFCLRLCGLDSVYYRCLIKMVSMEFDGHQTLCSVSSMYHPLVHETIQSCRPNRSKCKEKKWLSDLDHLWQRNIIMILESLLESTDYCPLEVWRSYPNGNIITIRIEPFTVTASNAGTYLLGLLQTLTFSPEAN